MKRVIIIGGGVAGMSAAHELIRRGFAVEVYEARSIPGGKARSVTVPNTGTDGRKDLPGEHGFRFFPRFYRNLPQTMREIPRPNGGTAYDNLVQASQELLARADAPNVLTLARFPRSLSDLKAQIAEMFAPVGLSEAEKEFAAARIWQLATSCDARFANEYERLAWWDFVEADRFSANYQALFAIGFTRTLVAARARSASTRVGGSILLQLLYGMVTPGPSTDRLLNGPTNDAWIDPWLADLRARGVGYHLNAPVAALHTDAKGRIRCITVTEDGQSREVFGDVFLVAVPVEVMERLLTPEILHLDPTLHTIRTLARDVAWMNGMQLYLDAVVDIDNGHTLYVDSPWALTSVSQLPFWDGFDIGNYGNGQVKSILSIDVSDWDAKGTLLHDGEHKCARQCTRKQIRDEVWAQLKASLNKPGESPVLRDEILIDWYLDSDIEPVDFHAGRSRYQDAEPLLVNNVNTSDLRPVAHTRIDNLFLAADYVKTDVSLATMEGANEAARRAVNGILAADGKRPDCRVYPLRRPWILAPFRWADARRYAKGLPWSDRGGLLGALRGLFA